jgi:hypothetical protein
MLEIDPETKVPYVFQRVYQHVFTAAYLLSTILNVPPPPSDLLFPHKQGIPVEDVSVDLGTEAEQTTKSSAEEGESEANVSKK